MNPTIKTYNEKADDFRRQYLSQPAETVHASWLNFLPKKGQALDVGAGVGRDAKWLADSGLEVVAVEPATELKKRGEALTQELPVFWVEDSLPTLSKVFELEMRFDLILLSAVWMHVSPSDRHRAFRKLSNLLKPGGIMVITLRHGKSPDERVMHPVGKDELVQYAQELGLSVKASIEDKDKLNRSEVFWETVVLQLPDDGTGAFPLLRNIIINDAKSSTYKLALMRVLLRIADGHPGAVIRREDRRVVLPLGLVSLYWARQYMPLIQKGIQQTSNPNRQPSFISNEGWRHFSQHSTYDLAVGNVYMGEDAVAMHKMLMEVGKTIKHMPAHYITFPNTDKQVFEVDRSRNVLESEVLYTDHATLSRYGEFSIPVHVWDLMSLYACWIEPVVINEWVNVMQGYENNKTLSKQALNESLEWLNPIRSTNLAKQRVEEIKQKHPVRCVWNNAALRKYDIDHCLPFSRWPNNDLWNLLPASPSVNRQKGDKIASMQKLNGAKDNITRWWQEAWIEDVSFQQKFFAQAKMSLPELRQSENNIEDVFSALELQHIRVRELQQLPVWR